MPVRLQALGTVSLTAEDGTALQSVLQQPRRLALLVYLAAVTRTGPVRRDAAIRVFWPDSTTDKARGALNQAIHYLRRSLGADAITGTADELHLNRELVGSDIADFMDAYEREDWKTAATLYNGELLPGFFTGDSADLDDWLEQTRDRLRTAAADAAWRLAQEAERTGDTISAAAWGRRACEWARGDEVVTRNLMRLLDRLGDRSGVIETYDSLVRYLLPLEVGPSRETVELREKLTERWAREDADLEARKAATHDDVASATFAQGVAPDVRPEPQAAHVPARQKRWRRARSALVTAGLALLLAFMGLAWQLLPGKATTREPSVPSPVLLVETVSGDGTSALFAEVVRLLQAAPGIRIVPHGQAPADTGDYVLRSALAQDRNIIRLTAQLMDWRTGTSLATFRAERLGETLSLVESDSLAFELAAFARREVGTAEAERALERSHAPARSVQLVRLGRGDRLRADSLRQAGSPGAARAAYDRSDSTFVRASSLAPEWSVPYAERAETEYRRLWLDLADLDAAFARAEHAIALADSALAFNEHDLDALEVRLLATHWIWQMSQPDPSPLSAERMENVARDARHLTALDPARARAWSALGGVLQARGEFGEAYWALQRALEADTYLSNDAEILLRLFTVAYESGDTRGARSWCNLSATRASAGWGAAYCRMALAAISPEPDVNEAAEALRMARSLRSWPQVRSYLEATAAVVYAVAGDSITARDLLQQALTGSPQDPELVQFVAWAEYALGEIDTARNLLDGYVSAAPAARAGVRESRRFRGLYNGDRPTP